MLDPRWQLDPTLIHQRYPGVTLPAGTTLRVAEVTAGVYRAAVHEPDGRQVVDHVATDDAEAVREAVALAAALVPLGPAARWRYLRRMRRRAAANMPWASRKRDRWLGVGIGVLLGALVTRLLWR